MRASIDSGLLLLEGSGAAGVLYNDCWCSGMGSVIACSIALGCGSGSPVLGGGGAVAFAIGSSCGLGSPVFGVSSLPRCPEVVVSVRIVGSIGWSSSCLEIGHGC